MPMDNHSSSPAPFDGLAEDYERYSPHYPAVLIDIMLAPLLGRSSLSVVDIGAGTGIALASVIERLGHHHHYHASQPHREVF